MFNYNDAWFMNESLAFYMSTSTFSNPLFDAQTLDAEPDEEWRQQQQQLNPSQRRTSRNNFEVLCGNRRSVNQEIQRHHEDVEEPLVGGGSRLERNQETNNRHREPRLGDSLRFSIRSKIFVWELNFKRKLRCLKKFARRLLPGLGLLQSAAERRSKVATAAAATTSKRPGAYISANLGPIIYPPTVDASIRKVVDHDYLPASEPVQAPNNGGDGAVGGGDDKFCFQQQQEEEDKFWSEIVEPKSREILMAQQTKILQRLERTLRADAASTCLLGVPSSLAPQGDQTQGAPPSSRATRAQVAAASATAAPSASPTRPARLPGNQAAHAAKGPPSATEACVVCFVNVANIVTLPCRHHEICSDCFIKMIYVTIKKSQYPLRCVLCRNKIERIKYSTRSPAPLASWPESPSSLLLGQPAKHCQSDDQEPVIM